MGKGYCASAARPFLPRSELLLASAAGKERRWLYDGSGNAAVDFDFDQDHGFGAPHAHNWDGNTRDQGNAFSLLPY